MRSRCSRLRRVSTSQLTRDLNVDRIRREIDVTGPGDGTAIDEDLLEKFGGPQRREHTIYSAMFTDGRCYRQRLDSRA